MAELTRTYPAGVTCWVDVTQPDVDAGLAFYGGLFGWTFREAMPPDAPARYVVAQLDGQDAAAVGSADAGPARWSTYVAVDDADLATDRLAALGAAVVAGPADAGPGGRTSVVTDADGAELHLWQARRRPGAQIANVPGAWNFSDLHSADPAAAAAFYAEAFGWEIADQGWGTSIRVTGYGDHLESTVDPDIRARQANAPAGFADVIGSIVPLGKDEVPHWHVTFTVEDRDDSAAAVERLGGAVLQRFDNDWVRAAVVRDPAGATFTISQFAPQDW